MAKKKWRIDRVIDQDGKVKVWPAKYSRQRVILEYLQQCFKKDVEYTERQVNDIITQNHTFNDYMRIRRSMVDEGILERETDGSKYWVSHKPKIS